MPDGLFKTDPIISQNFFLEIDGEVVTALMTVGGLDVEVSVATIQQASSCRWYRAIMVLLMALPHFYLHPTSWHSASTLLLVFTDRHHRT